MGTYDHLAPYVLLAGILYDYIEAAGIINLLSDPSKFFSFWVLYYLD